MPWTYGHFELEPTAAARLAMLRQHITEVRQQVGPDVGDGELNVNRGSMVNYLAALQARRRELEIEAAREARPGPVYVQKQRPGGAW